ncbi:MAG TPA: hypothetical protein VGC09_08550 [Rhodopila sp.]
MRRILLVTSIVMGPAWAIAGQPAPVEDLPVPPVPPEHPGFAENAPIPNADAQAPITIASDAPSFDVKFYRAKPYDPGLAWVPGSRYQTPEDRKPFQTPGVSISVPIK